MNSRLHKDASRDLDIELDIGSENLGLTTPTAGESGTTAVTLDFSEDSQNEVRSSKGCFRKNLLLLLTFAGVISGFVLGLSIRLAEPSPDVTMWIGLPGEVFMRMLKVLVLPLIISTIITGTANSDPQFSGRISLLTFGYILATNMLGGVLAIVLWLIYMPGVEGLTSAENKQIDSRNLKTTDIMADFIRNLFPDNIVGATIQQSLTKYTQKETTVLLNESGLMINVTSTQLLKSLGTASSTNVMGVIVCSVAVGLAASSVGERSAPLIRMCHALGIVVFKLFAWIKWTIPMGVACLITSALIDVKNLSAAVNSMAIYLSMMVCGNLILLLVVYTFIHYVMFRRHPLGFFLQAGKPAILAAGPASSAMALPQIIWLTQYEYKVDPRVFGFVAPLGSSLGRSSSCLFVTYTCLFISQLAGVEVSIGYIFTLCALVTMGSMALPAVPSASLVVVLLILSSLGVPPVGFGLIVSMEWLCDRLRTATNVVNQLLTILFVWKYCKDHLPKR